LYDIVKLGRMVIAGVCGVREIRGERRLGFVAIDERLRIFLGDPASCNGDFKL
jgi:hypothetical protein